MARLETPDRVGHRTATPSAVVWIDGRQAIVATMSADGHVSTYDVNRGHEPEPVYLTLVVRAIGDCKRVVILGPSTARLALEREYVAIFRRPDRLLDVEPAGPIDLEALVGRLRLLAA